MVKKSLILLIVSLIALPAWAYRTVKLSVERMPDLHTPRGGCNIFYVEGEVVVVGGHTNGFIPTSTAEYFRDGAWHLMKTVYEHDDGFFVQLKSGDVLIAGGHEKALGIGQTFPAEIYHPSTHSFEGFGCLDMKRSLAHASLLGNGSVVIAGNWYAGDSIELFDGKKQFSFVKKVSQSRSCPHIFPTGPDDAMIFSSSDIHGNRFDSIVIDRLKGDPFCVPLFSEWLPFHATTLSDDSNRIIGDEENGVYAYLLLVSNDAGQLAVAKAVGTDFSLLPLSDSIPTRSKWGKISYMSNLIVDRNTGKAYIVGFDDSNRLYVVSIAYKLTEKGQCAPITLYYTDPLECIGYTDPVLTDNGDLVLVGGVRDDNFKPLASSYLLPLGKPRVVENRAWNPWLWWVLVIVACVAMMTFYLIRRRRKTNFPFYQEKTGEWAESLETPEADFALFERICILMDEQKLYRKSRLKVSDVADELGVSTNNITKCIKARHISSFANFVNGYRVEYAKELLTIQPDRKISAIVEEAGFSNETSFFRTFKYFTGITPKEWSLKMKNEE